MQRKILTTDYVDKNCMKLEVHWNAIPNKNAYEQVIDFLKRNHGKTLSCSYVVNVHGGSYFVIGSQTGTYGGYIAFSYWDKICHIKDQDGVWTYDLK